MPLEEGKRLGLYEILSPLGSGGMGDVYRAHDTKLGRDVAVKVLPEHFAEDKDRMARFEREARVLASLNHPNIAAVYGLEESEGLHFLVMELVPGESLASKIQKGPLPVDEVMRITRQLIDALEAAHENGIVHRDLKPANVQITPDGLVKVLDFGLAKVETGEAPATDTSLSPTMTRDATQAGIILGTAPYMSPEQARGLPIDKRSDIFSFGCVVFEMLTGRKAFEGDLVSDVMASVIKSEPDWSLLPRPAEGFQKLLERCLEKDSKKRLRDIGDARVELEDATKPPEAVAPTSARAWRFVIALAAASAVVGAAVTALITRSSSSAPGAGGTIRLRMEVATPQPTPSLALSPDGRTLVQADSSEGLYLRPLDSWETQKLPSVDAAVYPFYSPDGEWIGFVNRENSGLYKVSVDGGMTVRVSDLPEYGVEPSWTERGTILIGAAGGIWEVGESGGELRRVLELPPNEGARAPFLPPGGRSILFQRVHPGGESIAALDLDSGEVTTLVSNGVAPKFLRSGHLVYVSGTTLMAAPFDAGRCELLGPAASLIEGVGVHAASAVLNFISTYAPIAISPSGTLAYYPAAAEGAARPLVSLDPSSAGAPETTSLTERVSRDLRVSPDGTKLAAHHMGGENDIWIYDFERETMSRLTTDPQEDETPAWSPDGRSIAFASQRGGQRTILRVPSDGSKAPEPLIALDYHAHVSDWSPDGKWLVLDVDVGPSRDVWLFDVEGSGEPRPLLDSRFNEALARVSPDGRLMAYVSDESGRFEIYVQRFPELGEKELLSNEGGSEPVWSRDGRRLFYRSPTHVMAVNVTPGSSLAFSSPEPVFEDRFYMPWDTHTHYDALPDGRFIMLGGEGADATAHINVVVNWIEEVEARVPR